MTQNSTRSKAAKPAKNPDRSSSWARHECPPLTHIEYNIYSYSNDDNPRACWQKCGSAAHADSAIDHAETLFNSGLFRKVEVKQKYFDRKSGQNIDETWRVFEKTRRTSPSSRIMGFAMASAMIAFALTYMMAST
jgi:hypothetical protein